MAVQRFVYVLRSRNHPSHFYTGRTFNSKERLASHNAGECTATKKYRPWDLDVVVAFRDETRALAFERYLKSGSACAFAKRHLLTPCMPGTHAARAHVLVELRERGEHASIKR